MHDAFLMTGHSIPLSNMICLDDVGDVYWHVYDILSWILVEVDVRLLRPYLYTFYDM